MGSVFAVGVRDGIFAEASLRQLQMSRICTKPLSLCKFVAHLSSGIDFASDIQVRMMLGKELRTS